MTKVALITGGQRGIGLGIAQALKEADFRLAIAAELPPDSDEVKGALNALSPVASYYRHDIRDADAAPELLDAIEADLGPLTSFVSNAGVAAPVRGDVLDLQPGNFDFVHEVNLKGAFFLAQEVARRMVGGASDHHRAMVFITSVSATLVSVERAEYCISKAGAAMMAQLFAARLASEGIDVFDVRPGIVATDMTAAVTEKYSKQIEEGLVPARRWGVPDDIGRTVRALVEGHLPFSNGAVVPVDGGLGIPRL
ncbi:MAG: 3-ketoacyl-ACP reductase [Pseudomonadota bacterium]